MIFKRLKEIERDINKLKDDCYYERLTGKQWPSGSYTAWGEEAPLKDKVFEIEKKLNLLIDHLGLEESRYSAPSSAFRKKKSPKNTKIGP